MQVTFLLYSAFPRYSGGRETWLRHVTSRLLERGHSVVIYGFRNRRAPVVHELAPHPGLTLVEVPVLSSIPWLGRHLVRSYLRVADMVLWATSVALLILLRRRERGGVFVAMGTVVDSLPLLLLPRFVHRGRFVCAVRGPHAANEALAHPRLEGIFRRIEKLATSSADLVLANGWDTQAELAGRGVSSVLVPNGVDVHALAPQRDGPAELSPFTVVMTASLMPYRGIDTAIDAIALMAAEGGSPPQLAFAGKGDPTRWAALAQERGVAHLVTFLGERRDVPLLLRRADVVLALCEGAHGGGLSMSLLEAMAAAKAVVIWDNPTYRQLIVDGRNGVVVPERDPPALARALSALRADADLRKELGRCAQVRAAEFDWEAVTDRVVRVLGSLRGGTHAPDAG